MSRTETVATHVLGDEYLLNGYKFYTSATTATVSFLLAKRKGEDRLSLFFTEVSNPENGSIQGVVIHKLKDKFGTKALPTAELELVNKRAWLVGAPGDGVRLISLLFNLTRVYSVCGSVAAMSTMTTGLRDYAKKRSAQGKLLQDKPLYVRGLARFEVMHRGCLLLFVKLALWLGEEERATLPSATNALLLR